MINILGPLPQAKADYFYLPEPGVMVRLSPPLDPPMLKGIKVYPNNPFQLDFILDPGDKNLSPNGGDSLPLVGRVREGDLKQEATRLIKYFLASLTIPEKDLWVNLSPYEKDHIIPQSFGLTEMGRDLLAEDYMLKQITASLIYPEDGFGKIFWKRIYEEAAKKFGTTDIPVSTFNKVWIVPERAVVYENAKAGTAYVKESKFKVMLEEDYLAVSKNLSRPGDSQPGDMFKSEQQRTCPEPYYCKLDACMPQRVAGQAGCQSNKPLNAKATQGANFSQSNINALGSQIVKEIVIPELTKEVNEDKNFVKLRQIYNSLILAAWYKKKILHSILMQVYADKNKIKGLSSPNVFRLLNGHSSLVVGDPEHIYQRYLQAFKKGVFNYIKEESVPIFGMPSKEQGILPRKYFSGGVTLLDTNDKIQFISMERPSPAMISEINNIDKDSLRIISTSLAPALKQNKSALLKRRSVLQGGIASALPFGGLTLAAGLLIPVNQASALTPRAREYIMAQNTRWGLPLQGELDTAAEKALNTRLADFLRGGHRGSIDHLQFLKKFMNSKGLNLDLTSYSVLIESLKIYFDEFKSRPKLSPQDLEDWSNLQADAVEFIQIFLLADATYDRKQEAVIGLIFGLPNQVFVYNCDSISALTVMIANEMGIDGINLANVKTDHNGNNYPDSQGIGHSNNILIKANGKVVVFDQTNKIEPTNSIVRLEAYDDVQKKLIVIGLSSVGPHTKFMTLLNLLEEEKVNNLFQQIGINVKVGGVITTEMYGSQAILEKVQRVLDEISSFEMVLQLNVKKKANFEKTLRIFQQALYNQVINQINADNKIASQLFNAQRWQEAAKVYQRVVVYANDQESKFYQISGFKNNLLELLREAIRNRNAALTNGRNISAFKRNVPIVADRAMLNDVGGIDLTLNKLNLEIQKNSGDIHFKFNPAMLARLQNVPGFVPVIINVQPLKDLPAFLGINENKSPI
jgi:hypothetical protein